VAVARRAGVPKGYRRCDWACKKGKTRTAVRIWRPRSGNCGTTELAGGGLEGGNDSTALLGALVQHPSGWSRAIGAHQRLCSGRSALSRFDCMFRYRSVLLVLELFARLGSSDSVKNRY